ncbi:protein phosphatase methylesterase 1-like [Oppia nitens]|uniref:protein phosphatase methylesterase 1-like n=1 Tax=Oppia nitens TaxID=1686743 RepID=UPI0023DBFE12|nr:protein phosphatase methylesterase 1-like [Oppia nitens]
MSSLERQIMNRRLPPMAVTTDRSHQTRAGRSDGRQSRYDYSPILWDRYFDAKRDLNINNQTFRVYLKGTDDKSVNSDTTNTPLVVMIHGGGYSGLTFGPFAQQMNELCDCHLLAIDLRGHGNTFTDNDEDLSVRTLATDIFNVITALFPMENIPPLVLMGHSMGGAIAVHCSILLEELIPRIIGLIVIDVVEGTAMDALQSMQSFLRSRPTSFATLEKAIEWCVRSGQTRNIEAAKLSMPGQLKNVKTNLTAVTELEDNLHNDNQSQSGSHVLDNKSVEFDIREEDEDNVTEEVANTPTNVFKTPEISGYTWRTNLFKSEPYWSQWFEDLSNSFLNSRANYKLLLLAGIDRLDRALTVGQMQGKFQMQVLPKCGHTVHEDVPDKVAQVVASFLIRNKFTIAKQDFERSFPSC